MACCSSSHSPWKLDLFPTGGARYWKLHNAAFCLAFSNMSTMARTTRSSMLETIRQDYVRTAAAKGVPRKAVILRHAFRNALIPTITFLGIHMSQLLGGSGVVETVFAWPGVGRLMIDSISSRDHPMVLGCIVLLTILFSVLNLVIDLVRRCGPRSVLNGKPSFAYLKGMTLYDGTLNNHSRTPRQQRKERSAATFGAGSKRNRTPCSADNTVVIVTSLYARPVLQL